MSDLRDSGQIEQDADAILMIHRPDYHERANGRAATNEVQVIVAEQRDGGRGNDVKLTANLEHQDFMDRPHVRDPFSCGGCGHSGDDSPKREAEAVGIV